MKRIAIVLLCALYITACGNNAKKNHDGHDPSHETGQVHEHGGNCYHDHSDGHSHGHDDHEHDHSPAEAHDQDHDHGPAEDHIHSASCTHDQSHEGHSHEEEDHDPDEIIFTREQAARTDFEVSTITAGTFSQVIKTSGRIMPAQGTETSIVAPVSGIVRYSGAQLSEGSPVARNRTLFTISSRNLESGDILARNRADFEKAKNDLDRAEKLLGEKIISKREYDEIRLAYELARTQYDALAGTSTGQGTAVNSPSAGYIYGLAVGDGDYVETGQLLATVSQDNKLVLRAEVSQKYLPRLSNITGANFTVPYSDNTYNVSALNGRLVSVGRNLLSGTSLLPVTFEFGNQAGLLPGTIVEVYLMGAEEKGVITIPVSAVTEQQGLYYVYIETEPEVYFRREVVPGAGDGMRIKILSGIEPGERVVTKGAVNVRMASASASIPHGHEH